MANITRAVESLKSAFRETLTSGAILSQCIAAGHRWRERKLGPVVTIWAFAQQILDGNTSCAHVARLISGGPVTDGAYCGARSRIPLEVFTGLFRSLSGRLCEKRNSLSWHGHPVRIVDATTCSMPDEDELREAFRYPPGQKTGCGFPVMHALALMEAGTGFLLDLVVSPLRTHDASIVSRVHRQLHAGDLLLGDRAFSSCIHLIMLKQRGIDGLFRLHQRRRVDFRHGRLIAAKDSIVQWSKPAKSPKWLSDDVFKQLPETIRVRVLEFTIQAKSYRSQTIQLVTTLLDDKKYSKEDLAKLYLDRWEIEVNFRHMKQTLNMEVLKCRSLKGVKCELFMFGIVYNLVRMTMLEAAVEQEVPPDRISFIDVMRWLSQRRPREPMPIFVVNPYRPGRSRLRVVKRRPKSYTYMQPHHLELML